MFDLYKDLTNPDVVDSLYKLVASISLYVTLIVAILLAVILVIAKNVATEEKRQKVRNYVFGAAVGYSVALAAVLGCMKLINEKLQGSLDANFYWILGGVVMLILLIIGYFVIRGKGKKALNWYFGVSTAIVAAYAIVMLCVVKTDPSLNDTGMYLFSALLIITAVLLVMFFDPAAKADGTRAIAYAAVCISMAFALSYVRFFRMPQGGSVTLGSMLPIVLYAYMFGAKRGVVAGVVYGMLQFIQSPSFYHPMQALLDFPIAFGLLGLAGIVRSVPYFKKNMLVGVLVASAIAGVFRYFAHVISGYFVFGQWPGDGYTALQWAFLYNTFVFVDVAIMMAIAALLLSSRAMRAQIRAAMAVEE